MSETIAHGYVGVFQRFVELSKDKSAIVELASFGPGGAQYVVR